MSLFLVHNRAAGTMQIKLNYTRKEAASCLGVSLRAIDYFLADGRLKRKSIGGRVVIPNSELIAFADRGDAGAIVPAKERKHA